MSAARYNLIIDQGTDFALEFIVKESGTAKDLSSGFSARAHIGATKDPAAALTKDFNCVIEEGGVAGKITAKLTNTETSAIAAGRYYYDLELVHSAVVTRLLEGTVTITQEVTR